MGLLSNTLNTLLYNGFSAIEEYKNGTDVIKDTEHLGKNVIGEWDPVVLPHHKRLPTNIFPNFIPSSLSVIMTFIIMWTLVFLFGKYLWNNVLCPLVPGVKESNSVWQIFGLMLLASLIFHS